MLENCKTYADGTPRSNTIGATIEYKFVEKTININGTNRTFKQIVQQKSDKHDWRYITTDFENYDSVLFAHGEGLLNNTGGPCAGMDIIKGGYVAKSGAQWKCASGNCAKTSYDQSITNYVANDFCDATYKSCNVVLQVNWQTN